MIAARDLTTAPPTRLLAEKRIPRPNLRLVLAGMGWIGLFLLLLLTTATLWQRGIMSSELLFWEARRRAVLELQPPDLTLLVSTDPVLVFWLLLPAGPVVGGVALLGTVVAIALSAVRRWVGLGGLWLPLLVIQPGIAVALAQYPSAIVRAFLLLVVVACLLAYVRGPRIVLILSAALSLGALTLVDAASWPLWIYLGLVLAFSRPMAVNERVSLLMVAFFPAVFLLLAWQYLGWTMHVTRLGLHDASGMLYSAVPSIELARTMQAPSTVLVGLGTSARDLLVYAPAYVVAVVLVVLTARARMAGWGGAGIGLLLVPAVDLASRALMGTVDPAPLGAVLPGLTILVAASVLGSRARLLVGMVLLVGAAIGWGLLFRDEVSEPARFVRQAAGTSASDPFGSLRELARAVDDRTGPSSRVLVDDPALFPLVALVREPATLLLPYRAEFGIAVQRPERFADLIVTTEPAAYAARGAAAIPAGQGASSTGPAPSLGPIQDEVPGYRLVTRAGNVFLYERLPLGAQADATGTTVAPLR